MFLEPGSRNPLRLLFPSPSALFTGGVGPAWSSEKLRFEQSLRKYITGAKFAHKNPVNSGRNVSL